MSAGGTINKQYRFNYTKQEEELRFRSPGPATSEAYSQISGNTIFPQIGPKRSFMQQGSFLSHRNFNDTRTVGENTKSNYDIHANATKTLTREVSKSSLVSMSARDRFNDNKKVFMPGQVGIDNAGLHSPGFNKYNTMETYKKTSKHGSNYKVPSFSFGTAKR